METNPELIQAPGWQRPGPVPVFLIHDGGGTTFAYHCLNPISRCVYGIHNPHFYSQDKFQGGIPEMARLYCNLVKEAVAGPDFPRRHDKHGNVSILLGGWSLGGLLSLEMAKVFSQEGSKIRVIGILLVDSVYPQPPSESSKRTIKLASSDMTEDGKSKNQILSQRAMAEAGHMIKTWTPPVWDKDSGEKRPRTFLLRAKELVPVEDGQVHRVDVYRSEKNLGWDAYDENMFEQVKDVEGHHYDVFSFQRIEGITNAIKLALGMLEMAALSDR